MQIAEMNLEEVNARLAEIESEVETRSGAELDALNDEVVELINRRAELESAEERARVAEELNRGIVQPDRVVEENNIIPQEERNMFDRNSVEYRNAFMAQLMGRELTEEQRSIFADNTNYGDGVALPLALDQQIWDQVHTQHPILADVTRVNAGMPIKVTKITPAAVTGKKDSAASSEQTFTTAEVTLVGKDFHTYVEISYAEAKMSQGAMEQFLVTEIANALGEALAKEVCGQIVADCGTAQKVTPAATPDLFDDLKKALALATQAARPVIYAPAAKYYEIVAAIKSGSPYNMANAVGCDVKLENAATKVMVLDPSMFLLDVVEDTMIESQRDAKNAHIVIGGYLRAEGCMRKTAAAAYIN